MSDQPGGPRRGGAGQSEQGDRTHAAQRRRPALRSRLSIAAPARPPARGFRQGPAPLRGGKARGRDNGKGRGRHSSASGRGDAAWGRLGAWWGRTRATPGRRALTLTKSSMRGSLSSSFNPFRGIDSAMAGWAGFRGRRLRQLAVAPGLLWLPPPAALSRSLSSLARWTVPTSSCPPAATDPQHRLTPRARLGGGCGPSYFKPLGGTRWAWCGRGSGPAPRTRRGEWAGQAVGARPRARKEGGERFGFPNGPLQSPEDRGAWPRLGSADWRGGAVSHAPRGGRAWSPEPEPDTASLRREAASSAAAAGWVPGDLMQRPASRPLPRCRRRTHRLPRPFPGRRPPRLLQLGAAAFSWKTFAKVFMSLRSTFFSSSSDCGHPLGMLLY